MKLIDRHVRLALPRAFPRDYSGKRMGCKRRALALQRSLVCHALRTFISHGGRACIGSWLFDFAQTIGQGVTKQDTMGDEVTWAFSI